MKTPVTKKTLIQHFTYSWWKYLLLVVLAVFGTDLIFTMTAYRSPADKVVQFYIFGYSDQEALDAYMAKVREEQMPDMEVMDSHSFANDDYYGTMQLSTYMAAAEGDLYLLPREQFVGSAASGAFLPLEDDAELIALFDEAGISLQNGWRRDTSTGETHLFGIPQSKLPGLTASYAYAQDGYLCVLAANGNDENVLKFLRILCQDTLTAPETEASAESEPAGETGDAAETEAASESETVSESETADGSEAAPAE